MLPQKIAFVDIETTGMRLSYDRVIEVGILRVEDNELTKTYQTLINPQKYLSPDITMLTGITSNQLDKSPNFREVKDQILEILKDCIFVAHNARFDYGFLKQEFKRLNISFSPRHFCTVKLSKSLYPRFKHHDLSSLIQRFNLECINRHRAFDDAKVLWDFYKIIQEQFDSQRLLKSVNFVLKRPSRPIKIDEAKLSNLPESPGVYIFYGENNLPLYVGKSINIKERVLSHFSSDHSSSSEMKISQQIQSIETVTTSGELGALIKESYLVKKLQPLYNRRLRVSRKLTILKQITNSEGYLTLSQADFEQIPVSEIDEILGIFKSPKKAKEFLIYLSKNFELCEKLLNIEKSKGACFGYRLGRCKGACINKESFQKYNLKFITAFSSAKIRPWPFNGPILIEEENLDSQKEKFLIDKWCYLGSIKSDGLDGEGIEEKDYTFDLDTYKILNSFIHSDRNKGKIKVIQNNTSGLKAKNSADKLFL